MSFADAVLDEICDIVAEVLICDSHEVGYNMEFVRDLAADDDDISEILDLVQMDLDVVLPEDRGEQYYMDKTVGHLVEDVKKALR